MLLSVLDYAMVDSGRTSQEALRETVALARLADELGYHRFWVAEHHQVPALASASPELMIMHLLGKTQRIMIGSGGIMLPHYQPYKVAEWVTTLRSLYPGRVEVAQGAGLRCAHDDASVAGRRRHRREEAVARPASHQVDRRSRVQQVADDVLQPLGVGGVCAGERLEDEPDGLRRSLRGYLPPSRRFRHGLPARFLPPGRAIPRPHPAAAQRAAHHPPRPHRRSPRLN